MKVDIELFDKIGKKLAGESLPQIQHNSTIESMGKRAAIIAQMLIDTKYSVTWHSVSITIVKE